MKRSPALIPLSRDHHHGLEAVRRLRRATGDDLDAAIARVDNPTARTSQSGVQLAHELGELLNDHIRFEERHLFGMLEARLPEDRLMLLGRAVEAAEASQP